MTAINRQEAYEIGIEAYTYLYPLVLMDATRRQAVNVEAGKFIGRGPMNTFSNVRTFPPCRLPRCRATEFRHAVLHCLA
jgi:hypothetical protein